MLFEAIASQDITTTIKGNASPDVTNNDNATLIKRIPIVRIVINNDESILEYDFLETQEENWIGSLSKKYPLQGLWFVKRLSVYLSEGISEVDTPKEQFIVHMKGKVKISTSKGKACMVNPLTILHFVITCENTIKLSDLIEVTELNEENLNVVLPVSVYS